jgi:dihydroflavonol-4-reductase
MAKVALVTGGTGFVGSAIVRELLRAGERVRVLRRANSPPDNLQGLDVEQAVGDLLEPDSLRAALDGVDRVYHCAALYALSGGYKRYLQANVVGTRNVLRACLEARVDRVVYTSTNAAVGSAIRGQSNEDQVWNFGPLNNPYITSKFIAEHEAMRFGARGLPVITVCPGAPVGPGDVKPTPTGKMIFKLIRGRYPLVVPVKLALVDVDDCGRHHRLAMEKGNPGDRYLSVGESLRLDEVLDILREVAGAPWRPTVPSLLLKAALYGTYLLPQFLNPLAAVARYPLHSFEYDTSRSRDELGMVFNPVSEALKRQAEWFAARRKT